MCGKCSYSSIVIILTGLETKLESTQIYLLAVFLFWLKLPAIQTTQGDNTIMLYFSQMLCRLNVMRAKYAATAKNLASLVAFKVLSVR